MFDFFRTPGGGLMGYNSELFEQARTIIDTCTSDMLIREDWAAVMELCDLINGPICSLDNTSTTVVLNEVLFHLRSNKLSARSATPRTVQLALTTIEAVVKNARSRLIYHAVNDSAFMGAIGGVVRKYNRSTKGSGASLAVASAAENRDVAETAIDVVQAWGEAFLPHKNTFGSNIVKTYQELRKEGFQFKEQYDAGRVPVITAAIVGSSSSGSGARGRATGNRTTDGVSTAVRQQQQRQNNQARQQQQQQSQAQFMVEEGGFEEGDIEAEAAAIDDAMLAAALQASIGDGSAATSGGNGSRNAPAAVPTPARQQPVQQRSAPSNNSAGGRRVAADASHGTAAAPAGASGVQYTSRTSLQQLLESLRSSITLMTECIVAGGSGDGGSLEELVGEGSVAGELHGTITVLRGQLVGPAMEYALNECPEELEAMLKASEEVGNILQLFNSLRDRSMSVAKAATELQKSSTTPAEPTPDPASATASSSSGHASDLLDIFGNTPSANSDVSAKPTNCNPGVTAAPAEEDETTTNLMHMMGNSKSSAPRAIPPPSGGRPLPSTSSSSPARAANSSSPGPKIGTPPAPVPAFSQSLASIQHSSNKSGATSGSSGAAIPRLLPPPAAGGSNRRPSGGLIAPPPAAVAAPLPAIADPFASQTPATAPAAGTPSSSAIDDFLGMSSESHPPKEAAPATTSAPTGGANHTSTTEEVENPFDLY